LFFHPLPIGFEVRRDGFANEALADGLNKGKEALWQGRLFSCYGKKRWLAGKVALLEGA